MTAVEVSSRFQQLQKSGISQLSAIVVDECNRLKLPYANEFPVVQPTSSETERITHHLEGDFAGLQFTVDVNLMDSKKAFKALRRGLDDNLDFMSLLKLNAHDPHTYPNPMGQIDMSFVTKAQSEEKDPKSA